MGENNIVEIELEECEKALNAFEIFKALDIVENIKKHNDYDSRVLVCEGRTLAALNRIGDAIERFSQAIENDPSYREAYVERGYYSLRAGNLLEGYNDLKKAMEIEEVLDGKLTLAKACLSLGNYEEGRELYKEMLNKYPPGQVQKHFLSCNKYIIKKLKLKEENEELTLEEKLSLSKSLLYINEMEEAFSIVENWYREVNDYDGLIVVGWIFGKNEKFDEAIYCLEKAIELDYLKPKAHLFMATTLELKGEVKASYKVLKALAKRSPEYEVAYINLARMCLTLGKFNEGLKNSEKSIELNCKVYYSNYIKGCVLNRLGKHKEALSAIEEAMAQYDGDGDYYAEKSYSLRNLGHIREANEICDTALEYGFDTEKLNIEKGLILKVSDYEENAISWLDAALEYNNRSKVALFNKAACLYYIENYDEALEMVNEMINMGYDEALVYGSYLFS